MKKLFSSAKSNTTAGKQNSASNRTDLSESVSSPVRPTGTEFVVNDAVLSSGTARARRRLIRKSNAEEKTMANLPAPSASIASTPSADLTEMSTPEPVRDRCYTVTVGATCFGMLQDEIRAQHAQGNPCSEDQVLEGVLGSYFAKMHLTAAITGRPLTHCSPTYLAKMREASASFR
ncbi:MAG: hypothetical protein EOO61_06535 [Hymenobacter sp.]|nr:MAG: hypothetical protein EOO61_06535 [Hymenobacter sp.]